MSRRKSHDGNTSPHSDAIKSFALEEVVRSCVDNCGTGYGQAARGRRVQRQRFEDQQISPPPGHHLTCGAPPRKLDEHVTSVNEGPKLRTLAARRRSGRVSCDGGLSESRIIATRPRRDVERLPAGKRFIPNNEIARQILTAPGHRNQNVMIRPIGEARGQPQIRMIRGDVSSQETRWPRVCQFCRQSVRHGTLRHPNRLMGRQCQEFACRLRSAVLGYSKQRKASGIKTRPRLSHPVSRGAGSTNLDHVSCPFAKPAHQGSRRNPQSLPEVRGSQNSTTQLDQCGVHVKLFYHGIYRQNAPKTSHISKQ